MLQVEEDLQEFIEIPTFSNETDDTYRWTHGDTLVFLDLYKVYRKQLGTQHIKTLKRMFCEISKQMRVKTGKNVSPTNCENRWRVLERAYKKYIAHNNSTGASRKNLEYSEIMFEILGKKKNIFPEVLLSSETVSKLPAEVCVEASTEMKSTESTESAVPKNSVPSKPSKPSISKEDSNKNKNLKRVLLKQIRQDRQHYYNRRLQQEDAKLEEKMKKNRLLEEKNELLRQLINKDSTNDTLCFTELS